MLKTDKVAQYRILFMEELTVSYVVKNFPHFVEHGGEFPFFHQPTSCPYPEADETSPRATPLHMYDSN